MTDGAPPGRWSAYDRMAQHVAPAGERLLDLVDGGRSEAATLLDVGSGSGLGLRAAADRGWVAIGLDRSEDQVAAAGSVVRQVRGDALALPFERASFDAAVSNFALIFAGDVEHAVTEVSQVVRPNGWFAFSAWRPGGWPGAWRRRMATALGREPTPFPTGLGEAEVARALLVGAGFVDVVVHPERLRWEFADVDVAVDTLTSAAGGLRMLRSIAVDAGAWPTVRELLLDDADRRAVPLAGGGIAIDDEFLAVAGRRPDSRSGMG